MHYGMNVQYFCSSRALPPVVFNFNFEKYLFIKQNIILLTSVLLLQRPLAEHGDGDLEGEHPHVTSALTGKKSTRKVKKCS